MGTRAIIMVTGACGRRELGKDVKYDRTYRFYRHSGGSPDEVLNEIGRALIALGKRRASAMEFLTSIGTKIQNTFGVDPVAMAILSEGNTPWDIGTRIDKKWEPELEEDAIYQGPVSVDMLGEQFDLEWVYVVDCNRDLVNCYSTKCAGEYYGTPQESIGAGCFVDHDVFLREYTDIAKDGARLRLLQAEATIQGSLYRLNEAQDVFAEVVPAWQPERLKPSPFPASR